MPGVLFTTQRFSKSTPFSNPMCLWQILHRRFNTGSVFGSICQSLNYSQVMVTSSWHNSSPKSYSQRQLERFCNLTPFRFSSIICLRRNAQCGLYQIVARQALSHPVYQPVAIVEPERFKDFTRTSQKCEIGSCYQSQIECCQTNYGWLKKLSWGRAKMKL